MKYSSPHKNNQGFVILFAVLVSSIILLIGMGMFRISIKETVLSSTARESTMAFFAADSGMECALYAEIQENAFEEGSIQANICRPFFNGATNISSSGSAQLRVANPSLATCARVDIQRNNGAVTMVSSGYNICMGQNNHLPNTNSPLLLQRELFITYSR